MEISVNPPVFDTMGVCVCVCCFLGNSQIVSTTTATAPATDREQANGRVSTLFDDR